MFFSHNFAGRGVEPIKQPHNFGPGPLARARYFLVVIQPPVIDRHSPSQMRQNVQFVLSCERQCTFPHARQLMSQNHRVEAAAKVTRHADVQRRRLVQLLHTLNNDRKKNESCANSTQISYTSANREIEAALNAVHVRVLCLNAGPLQLTGNIN